MVQQFNNLGLKVGYYMTNTRCASLGNDKLEIRWVGGSGAPNNPLGFTSIAYYQSTVTDWPCYSHCVRVAQIVFDTDEYLHLDGDPFRNWTYTSQGSISNNQLDFRQTLLHELGHAGGLGHTDVRNSIMCSEDKVYPCNHVEEIYGPGTVDRTYDQDDIDGFCSLWKDDPSDPGNVCN
jgi:hypothetical protein